MNEQNDKVHTVYDWYDGPRSGAANYRGTPYWYRSVYLDNEKWNPDEDRFELTPLSPEALAWERERDAISRRWDAARKSGNAVWKDGDEESFGALPEDMDQYRHANRSMEAYLAANAPTLLVRGSFLGNQEVRWMPVDAHG